MKQSFVHHFNTIAPSVQPCLAGPECRSAITELCSFFPYDLARNFGFESRLGNPGAFCDFLFQIRKNTEGAKILAGKSSITGLSDRLLDYPLWQRISRFFDAWTTPGHMLAETIEECWLEFDYDGLSYNLSPSIFFGIRNDRQANRNTQWESRRSVLDEIYQVLFDIPFPDALAANLKSCILSLPEGADFYWTGFMIPRQTEAIRLVFSMPSGKLEQYFNDINWTGDYEAIRFMIDHYVGLFDYFNCNLTIGEAIFPYFAMELHFRNQSQPRFNPNWNSALDLLETDKLLTHEKREALLGFCGKTIDNHFYPIKYIRGINHLKLVYRRNMPLECKGYFGLVMKEDK